MPIEFACGSCGKKLRVKETAAGKRVRCSGCQTVLQVPAASSAAAPRADAPGPPPTPSNNWHVKTGDGQTYGPVSKEELDSWATEGRLTAQSQILREGSDQWQWATDEYPQLSGVPQPGPAGPGAQPENPFDFAAADTSPTARTRQGRSAAGPLAGVGGDSGRPPAPRTPGPPASGTGGTGKQAATEPAWYSVLDGLLIAMVNLGIGFVCAFILGVSRLWVLHATSSSLGTVKAMVWFTTIATMGIVAASVSLVTGWCLCLKVPRRVRADIPIRIAVGAVGGLLLLAFIMSVIPMVYTPKSFESLKNFAKTMEVIQWLMQVVAVGSLVGFGFFLCQLGRFFSHRQLPLLAVCYAAFAGVHVIWLTIEAFAMEANSKGMKTLLVVLLMLFGLGHMGWLAYMSFMARDTARRAVARSERG